MARPLLLAALMFTTLVTSTLLLVGLGQAADAPVAPAGPTVEEQLNELRRQVAELKAAQQAPAPAPAPEAKAEPKPAETNVFAPSVPAPFGFADFSWMPGNAGGPERPFSFGPFTGELRVDTVYHHSFAEPKDDTISGSSEVFRHGEFQVTQLGFGGDFYYRGLMARMMTQFGMYSVTTPRNDASPGKGNWDLYNAYRYISEAYGGYHFEVWSGINVQAGIFMSYVGLWGYYNFDNWTYQPSYVSSNTPWFFDGMRVQVFPDEHLKIEAWLVNGWQSYGRFNNAPGVGLQIAWRPTDWFSILGNQYFGTDTLGNPDRKRIHTDDSVMVKYYDNPSGVLSKAAASLTLDAGCEWGGGADCAKNQFFLGFMAYNRLWFLKNQVGLTVGGGAIRNPGRYLVLIPPINGASALSGTPYFTANPGDKYDAWDMQLSADYSPIPYVTLRVEFNHRASSVPYFTGPGGVTPPGGNNGSPALPVFGWSPDLAYAEDRVTAALMVKL